MDCQEFSELGLTDNFPVSLLDLSHPYTHTMLDLPPHGQPFFNAAEHLLSGTPFQIGKIAMSTHTGTHIDFPRHLLPHGKTQDDYPIGYFVGSAVVLDLTRQGIVEITLEDLLNSGPPVEENDIVLLHFGYANRFGSHEYRTEHPYLSEEVASYLVDQKVRILGLDLQTPDLPASRRGENFSFPAHRILLTGDCLIIENLGPALGQILGRRVSFMAAPLRIPGADGVPVRPLAWW